MITTRHAEKPPLRGRKRLRRESAALKRCSTVRNDHESVANVTVCLRCLVSGRVQGVFFRAATREKARQIGVEVRPMNLPDGRVEVLIWGESAPVERLRTWLWQGPPAARVDDVQCTPGDANAFDQD
ncbi:MAG: acylphosphatase [Gammaproteobacteria bacterium]